MVHSLRDFGPPGHVLPSKELGLDGNYDRVANQDEPIKKADAPRKPAAQQQQDGATPPTYGLLPGKPAGVPGATRIPQRPLQAG